MITASLGEVADVLNAEISSALPDPQAQPFPQLSIDSRKIKTGDCFVAIHGERLDGHDFISAAVQSGAGVVIHSRSIPPDIPLGNVITLRVKDTFEALHQLTRFCRSRWGGKVVAITGSMGKTTTRHFAATLLRERFQVCESPGNFNNEFGVPISLLGLRDEDEVAVIEMGMNHAGEIRRLSRLCDPDLALITNVAPVHLEFFDSVDAIARAKEEILEGLKTEGVFLYNADDQRVRAMSRRFRGRSLSFGLSSGSEVRVAPVGLPDFSRMQASIQTPGGRFEVDLPFSGQHYLGNLAAAACVAVALGLSNREIASGLQRLSPLQQRGRIREVLLGSGRSIRVVDESYNANPEAVRSILTDFSRWPWPGRKVVVLGDMLELGSEEASFHREIGRCLPACEPSLVVAIGRLATEIRRGALEMGMSAADILQSASVDGVIEALQERLRDGDLVLLKGSRGVGLEKLIQRLEGTNGTQEEDS